MSFTNDFLIECANVCNIINEKQIEKVVNILKYTRNNKGRLFIIGSGGGAGNASHAVCDFRKLCNIEAYAPYDNISELTARTNDDGWDTTLINWLKVSNLTINDCVFVLSVGGGNEEKNISMNIVNAIKYAKKLNCCIVGIVSENGGYTKKMGDIIEIPNITKNLITPITEGFQAIIWHLLVSHPELKINQTIW